jgi:hypothetical protein
MCAILIPEAAGGIAPGHRYAYDVMGSGEAVRLQITESVASADDGVLMIEAYGFE